jgi:hypothetical protein
MTLLRKWVDALRARLIADAANWHRYWSVRLAAFGAAVEAFLQWFPDQAKDVWSWLPDSMRAALPGWLTSSFPIALFVAVIATRLIAQKKAKSDG